MVLRRSETTFYLLIVLLLSVSCNRLNELVSVQKTTLSISDYRISALTLEDIAFTFDVEVNNPNPWSVSVSEYSYDFQISEQSLVTGSQTTALNINASQASIIQVPVQFSFRDVYATISDVREQEETSYSMNTRVTIDVPILGVIDLPLEKEGTFPIPKTPKLSLSSLSIEQMSVRAIDLTINVLVENPNTFALSLSELDYDLKINGLTPLNGTIVEAVNLAEKESTIVSIPLSLTVMQLGMSVYRSVVSGESFEYTLSGTTEVGSSLPFFKKSSFNFDKSGVVNILK